ncbi:hypothetical protein IPL85_02545 [Candidatus Saccharibacteria bacterium]|nr:MAG: hypothetical protein IPL85_02545 [Candidatus Saccharibacteria bacterium]
MPFTGTGTGIQNANDVFFSVLAQDHILRYDNATAKWINIPLSVATTALTDNSVTEPKLSISNAPTTNYVLSWNGSAMTCVAQATGADATTTTKVLSN